MFHLLIQFILSRKAKATIKQCKYFSIWFLPRILSDYWSFVCFLRYRIETATDNRINTLYLIMILKIITVHESMDKSYTHTHIFTCMHVCVRCTATNIHNIKDNVKKKSSLLHVWIMDIASGECSKNFWEWAVHYLLEVLARLLNLVHECQKTKSAKF